MRPGPHELDDEIRGHIAISIQERIERGEDPEAARLAAMKEFGNLLLTQESMREVWRPRWVEAALAFLQDVRVAMRSLRHAKGLAATVALMLALGNRRQRRRLQRRAPGAVPAARQPRRRPPRLRPAGRARSRLQEHDLLDGRDPRPARGLDEARRVR